MADYVLALEAEIQNLKHKFKTLEEQLEEPSRVSSSNADIQPSVSTSAGATGESPCPVVAHTLSVFFLNCNANPQEVQCGDRADIGPRHQHPRVSRVPTLTLQFSFHFHGTEFHAVTSVLCFSYTMFGDNARPLSMFAYPVSRCGAAKSPSHHHLASSVLLMVAIVLSP